MNFLEKFNSWSQNTKKKIDPKSYCNKCGHYHFSMLSKRCMKVGCKCKVRLDITKE